MVRLLLLQCLYPRKAMKFKKIYIFIRLSCRLQRVAVRFYIQHNTYYIYVRVANVHRPIKKFDDTRVCAEQAHVYE